MEFFDVDTVYDISLFPSLISVIFIIELIMSPITNAFSRKLEKKADLFALSITNNRNAFVSLMRKLESNNLSDPHPPVWVKIFFYDHPTIAERISYADQFGN